MLVLKLLEDVGLFLLITRGFAHLLLPLIVHHLLDHATRVAVQVAQLAVIRLDLAYVDLGCRGDHVCPPLHLVDLLQVDLDRLGIVGRRRQGPGAVIGVHGVGEVTLQFSVLVCSVVAVPDTCRPENVSLTEKVRMQ
jgi:hypothetical protein